MCAWGGVPNEIEARKMRSLDQNRKLKGRCFLLYIFILLKLSPFNAEIYPTIPQDLPECVAIPISKQTHIFGSLNLLASEPSSSAVNLDYSW